MKRFCVVKFENSWLILCIDRFGGAIRVRVMDKFGSKIFACRQRFLYEQIMKVSGEEFDKIKKDVEK